MRRARMRAVPMRETGTAMAILVFVGRGLGGFVALAVDDDAVVDGDVVVVSIVADELCEVDFELMESVDVSVAVSVGALVYSVHVSVPLCH